MGFTSDVAPSLLRSGLWFTPWHVVVGKCNEWNAISKFQIERRSVFMKVSRCIPNNRTVAKLLIGLGMISTLVACGGSSHTTTPPPPTVAIVATSGSGQTATAGSAFAAPLVATVTTGGTPTSGVTVTFTAPASGASGTFAGGANTATTDANGIATSAAFAANSTAGSYIVTANVSGASSPA